MTNARVSQEVIEALVDGTPNARVSQEVIEPLVSGTPNARVSQEVIESLVSGTANARVSQIVKEVLNTRHPNARVSQIVLEVLCLGITLPMPALYPDLPGLGYSQFWNPHFFNQSEVASAGANIDVALSSTPVHEFELTYDFLRANGAFMSNTPEFKIFFSFFLAMGGQVGRFLYPNIDDRSVTGQFVATTDGSTSVFGPLNRTFGYGGNNSTEPVGYVDLTQPVNVYLNGVKQAASSFQILQTLPMNQQLKFFNTPSADQTVTIDMSYFYYCKFTEDTNTFEKFMYNLWSVKKVTLRSCKAGT
jgi:hypothetical protein